MALFGRPHTSYKIWLATDGQADRRTDVRRDGQKQRLLPPPTVGGIITMRQKLTFWQSIFSYDRALMQRENNRFKYRLYIHYASIQFRCRLPQVEERAAVKGSRLCILPGARSLSPWVTEIQPGRPIEGCRPSTEALVIPGTDSFHIRRS